MCFLGGILLQQLPFSLWQHSEVDICFLPNVFSMLIKLRWLSIIPKYLYLFLIYPEDTRVPRL